MTTESRAEIIMVVVLAVFLALLWWMNRQAGAGTGLENTILPLFGGSAQAAPDAFDPGTPGTLAGSTLNYAPGGTTWNLGAPTVNFTGAVPGACGCASSANAAVYGSEQDMAQFLTANPSYIQTMQDGLTNWN